MNHKEDQTVKKARAMEYTRIALRVFAYQVAFGFFGLMFVSMLMGAGDLLRIPLVGLIIAMAGLLLFSDGAYHGEKDMAASETLDRLEKSGEYQASVQESAKRFSRTKGALGAMLGAVPVLLIAAYVAVTAVPYAYTLQDLPGWLSPYLPRAEIGNALNYLKDVAVTATVTDYLRVAARFFLFPYVGLFGETSDAFSLWFDRLSPLLVLVMPLLSAIGYQFGPSRRAKSVKLIEEAKNKPRRRLKKEARKRIEPEKKQLI